MSMISAQCDQLQERAKELCSLAPDPAVPYLVPSTKETMALAMRSAASEMEDAANTIYELAAAPTEAQLEEWGYVKLPVDADGEPIHAGDVLDGYGKTIEVVEMRYGRGGWVLISRDGSGYADTFAFTHHHAPTVEDVLRDMLDSLDLDPTSHVDTGAVVAEYAAKLREDK